MYQFLDSANYTAPEVQRKRSGSIANQSNAHEDILKCLSNSSSPSRSPVAKPRTPIQAHRSPSESPTGKFDHMDSRRPSLFALSARINPSKEEKCLETGGRSRSNSLGDINVGDSFEVKRSKDSINANNEQSSPSEIDKTFVDRTSPIRPFAKIPEEHDIKTSLSSSEHVINNKEREVPIMKRVLSNSSLQLQPLIDTIHTLNTSTSPKAKSLENNSPTRKYYSSIASLSPRRNHNKEEELDKHVRGLITESRRPSLSNQTITITSPENVVCVVQNNSPLSRSQSNTESKPYFSNPEGKCTESENSPPKLRNPIYAFSADAITQESVNEIISSEDLKEPPLQEKSFQNISTSPRAEKEIIPVKSRSNSIVAVPHVVRLEDDTDKFQVAAPTRYIDLNVNTTSSVIDPVNPWSIDIKKLESVKKSLLDNND